MSGPYATDYAGEIREMVSGANLLVTLDAGGDKKADLTIVFTKFSSLTAADFKL